MTELYGREKIDAWSDSLDRAIQSLSQPLVGPIEIEQCIGTLRSTLKEISDHAATLSKVTFKGPA